MVPTRVLGPVLLTLYTQPIASVNSVIRSNDTSYHFYSHDSDLYASCAPAQLGKPSDQLSTCVSGVKDWTIQNKVKLSEDKTEAMVLGKPSVLAGVSIDAIDLAGCQIALSSSLRHVQY